MCLRQSRPRIQTDPGQQITVVSFHRCSLKAYLPTYHSTPCEDFDPSTSTTRRYDSPTPYRLLLLLIPPANSLRKQCSLQIPPSLTLLFPSPPAFLSSLQPQRLEKRRSASKVFWKGTHAASARKYMSKIRRAI